MQCWHVTVVVRTIVLNVSKPNATSIGLLIFPVYFLCSLFLLAFPIYSKIICLLIVNIFTYYKL